MNAARPALESATRESVLREFPGHGYALRALRCLYFEVDASIADDITLHWTKLIDEMAQALADARNEIASLQSEIEHIHRVASMIEVGLRREIGLLQAENASQRAYNNTLMDDTVTLRAVHEENERLRALVAAQENTLRIRAESMLQAENEYKALEKQYNEIADAAQREPATPLYEESTDAAVRYTDGAFSPVVTLAEARALAARNPLSVVFTTVQSEPAGFAERLPRLVIEAAQELASLARMAYASVIGGGEEMADADWNRLEALAESVYWTRREGEATLSPLSTRETPEQAESDSRDPVESLAQYALAAKLRDSIDEARELARQFIAHTERAS